MAALVLAAAVTLVLASAAASSASPVTCGQTITADITLTKNLDCPGTGLVIGVGGLALDLGGHTISAAGRPIAGAPATIENGS